MPKPPFRADHVGSLLRPDAVVAGRKKHVESGTLDSADMRAIEDQAIVELISMQESVGLKAVTDGEQRRS